MEPTVRVNLFEMIVLDQIKLRHEKLKLQMGSQYINIMTKILQLGPDTPVEEMQRMQDTLAAILDNLETEIQTMEKEKTFVKNIMDRSDKENGNT